MLSYYTAMEAPRLGDVMTTPIHHPSSPPITPDSGEPIRATRSRALPNWKRRGFYGDLNFSPPSDDGESHDDHLRASTPELLAVPRSRSRHSATSSGFDGSPSRHRSTPEIDSFSESSERRPSTRRRRNDDNEWVIEEIADDDSQYMNRSGILKPDACEDADSERAVSPFRHEQSEMFRKFEDLHHDDEDAKLEELRRWKDKKKRWSYKSKRTFSESCGSDKDDEDTKTLDFNDVGSSARRVKRKTSGVNERTSLIFDDPPPEHITEVDEPDDELLLDPPPPYAEIDVDWSGLQDMPFYDVADPMRLDDSESSESSAPESKTDSDGDSDSESEYTSSEG